MITQLNQSKFLSTYIRYALLFFMCSFAATFYMVEAKIALIHIQLGAIIILAAISAFLNPPKSIWPAKNKVIYLGLISLWLCILVSVAINNEWRSEGFKVLNNKIWLWVLPLVFLIIPKLNIKESFLVICSYLCGITILSSLAVYKFITIKLGYDTSFTLKNFNIIDPDIIPFKLFHHTLSVYLALGIVFIIVLFQFYKPLLNKALQYLFASLVAVFVVFIFLISARIGFVTVLFLFGSYALRIYLHLNWKWYTKVGSIAGALVVFSVIVCFIPNTRERIKLTLEEINRAEKPEENVGENISARILAYKVASSLLCQYPWKGVSFSNENDEYMREYQEGFGITPDRHPFKGNPLKPHTEFFRYLVVLGIPLGSLFILFYFSLFLVNKTKLRFDYWLYLGVFSLYMMTDFPFHLKEVFYMFCFFMPFWAHILELFDDSKTE